MQNKDENQEFTYQNQWNDPIITSHPYFMKNQVKTFLDEDTAVNVNNSEDPSPEE